MNEIARNKLMVDGQIKPMNGMTKQLLTIFYSLDRDDFIPEHLKKMSYVEKNLEIEKGRLILKPELVAKIVLGINIKVNENVLLLGSASGYLSAVLSHQAETVIVVEENDTLLAFSENAIKKNNINNVVFLRDKIVNGCIDQSPFNAIIIEGAVEEVPSNILSQLDEDGRLLAIVSRDGVCSAILYRKKGNIFNEQQLFNCSLPTLDVFKNKNSFSF